MSNFKFNISDLEESTTSASPLVEEDAAVKKIEVKEISKQELKPEVSEEVSAEVSAEVSDSNLPKAEDISSVPDRDELFNEIENLSPPNKEEGNPEPQPETKENIDDIFGEAEINNESSGKNPEEVQGSNDQFLGTSSFEGAQVPGGISAEQAGIEAQGYIATINYLIGNTLPPLVQTKITDIEFLLKHNDVEDNHIQEIKKFFAKSNKDIAEILLLTKEEVDLLREKVAAVLLKYRKVEGDPWIDLIIAFLAIGFTKAQLIFQARKSSEQYLQTIIREMKLNVPDKLKKKKRKGWFSRG